MTQHRHFRRLFAMLVDDETKLKLGDPRRSYPSASAGIVRASAQGMIRSVSGWRKIFAADENALGDGVSAGDVGVLCCVAAAYAEFLSGSAAPAPGTAASVGIAVDSRPTGRTIADILIRCLVACGLQVEYLFIAPTPQLLAMSAAENSPFSAFIMVTASHNPVGYNGLKFGRNGSVLVAAEHSRLLAGFEQLLANDTRIHQATLLPAAAEPGQMQRIFANTSGARQNAARAYHILIERALNPREDTKFDQLRKVHFNAFSRRKLGIVSDHNGGARTTSIDSEFLGTLGVQVRSIHNQPGEIHHAILPEGEALTACCRALETAHSHEPGFLLGYVTDNDGDRGTTIMLHSSTARPMEAQEVFALACAARLSSLAYQGVISYDNSGRCITKVAVVVNGPTSLRVERIADIFGAEVFRAEVGEANVVARAAELRRNGYLVPILGEGSNGGCIIPPAQVRDPLLTVSTVLSLLLPPTDGAGFSRFDSPLGAWQERLSLAGMAAPAEEPPLSETNPEYLLSLLPGWSTTGTGEDRAVVQLHTSNYGALKNLYEELFEQYWLSRHKEFAQRFGFESYSVVNHVGTEERVGAGPSYRVGAERSGMKILFKNAKGISTGFIWMRPSGTEPVFRVCADIEGCRPEDEAALLQLHTQFIQEADRRLG